MPHLYTHLENGNGLQRDETGQDFADIDAAVRDAGRTAGQVISDEVAMGRSPIAILITIEDADARRVATLTIDAHVRRH